ncbi:hypothetical protein KA005_21520, partial [bacterium]|nr:hypothetical protein [bacterium]
IKAIGHNFYPPDRIEPDRLKSNVMKSLLKPTPKPGTKIKFRINVISSVGSKAAEFTVEADSKVDADILARKMIRKLGLAGATYKLS